MRTNHQPDTITAAILAGGQGSRVDGRDKGLIELRGRPLVEHVLDALSGQVADILVCANRHRAEYARYAPVCTDREAGFLGPLAGIASAMVNTNSPWLMTVPVDSPQPPGDLASRLLQAAVANDCRAAVAHDGQRRQPLFALYRIELAEFATRALRQDLAVWRWQDEIGTIEVDFLDSQFAFVNLNTLEDFRRWEQQHE